MGESEDGTGSSPLETTQAKMKTNELASPHAGEGEAPRGGDGADTSSAGFAVFLPLTTFYYGDTNTVCSLSPLLDPCV